MFILRFFRYLAGYVRFRAQGVFIERFLNLAARERISIWNGHKRGEEYTGYVSASGYPRLRGHAKKAGVRIRILEKHGAPFQRRRYRRRKGLLLGLACFLLFLFVMSRFIWRIEVGGLNKMSEARIIETLDEIGIRPGTWRGSIDVRDAERQVLIRLSELSWAALNIDGSRLRVEINESVPPPPMVDPNRPCNIVASYSGQILTMRVYEGQSLVSEGDAVLEGDMLVSGIKQDRLEQNLFKHALADIHARVTQELRVEVPLDQTEYAETGITKKRLYLQIFSWEIPLFLPSKIPLPYHVERQSKPLRVLSSTLPFGLFEEQYILMEARPVTYTEQEAKELALRELKALETVELADAEIENRSLTGTVADGVFILSGQYTCTRNIALEKEILQLDD